MDEIRLVPVLDGTISCFQVIQFNDSGGDNDGDDDDCDYVDDDGDDRDGDGDGDDDDNGGGGKDDGDGDDGDDEENTGFVFGLLHIETLLILGPWVSERLLMSFP